MGRGEGGHYQYRRFHSCSEFTMMLVLAFFFAKHLNLVLSLFVLTGSLVHLKLCCLQLILESLHLHLQIYPFLVQLSQLTEPVVRINIANKSHTMFYLVFECFIVLLEIVECLIRSDKSRSESSVDLSCPHWDSLQSPITRHGQIRCAV